MAHHAVEACSDSLAAGCVNEAADASAQTALSSVTADRKQMTHH